MSRIPSPLFRAALPLALVIGFSGCHQPTTTIHRSGLMEYLYPKAGEAPTPDPRGARLQLPLRVGIAFVPAGGNRFGTAPMGPALEQELLDAVRGSFKDKPWVSEVRMIPSTYLQGGGGFTNLDGIRSMFGVDVVALVSVNQVQHTDPKWFSFLYLSIVGAYTLKADANDTNTLMDIAVFHIPTRTFLFRAPGVSRVKGSTTTVDRERSLREASTKGYREATRTLAANLDREVEAFKQQIAQGDRKDVDLIDRQGQSLQATGGKNWGGALPIWQALVGAVLLTMAWWRRRS